jgi:nicotinamide-nucleotide amidase
MRISVLCVGDELLKGFTVNTNMSYIGLKLHEKGLVPDYSATVPDFERELHESLSWLCPLSDVIICTGGLGPTADDVTKQTIAKYFGLGLRFNEGIAENLRGRWKKLRRPGEMPKNNLVQAMIPEGAEIIPNKVGTAPGVLIEHPRGDKEPLRLFMLPGPPFEMRPMLDEFVIPRIISFSKEKCFTALYFGAGIPESVLEEMFQPVINEIPGLGAAYCASPEGVRLFLRHKDENALASAKEKTEKLFGKNLLAPESGFSLQKDIIRLLRENKARLALAESCTGGIIAGQITDIPGASDVFAGGVVCYSNESKINLLDVSPNIIDTHGAVSPECAGQMLSGALKKFGAEAGIAVTGIAGPDGGTDKKPVGLVYIAAGWRGKNIVKELPMMGGGRELIRLRSAGNALNTLRRLILGIEQ